MASRRLEILNNHLKTKDRLSQNNVSSPDFLYTLNVSGANQLSYRDRQFYEQNGFLVVRKLVSPHHLEQYRARFIDICDNGSSRPGLTILKDVALAKKTGSIRAKGEAEVTKIQNFQYDEDLFHYCALPGVLDYVENFCGENISAMHTMLINKPPDVGSKTSRHPLHQDLYYFSFRPADRIVCAWTAMEPVTKANGCLVVSPGSHRRGTLYKHGYPQWEGGVNHMYFGIEQYKEFESNRVHLEMDPGDTVFFHPLLVHGSGTNRTTGFRKAISCHYAATDCYHVDPKSTGQDLLEENVSAAVGTKLKDSTMKISLQDTWKILARPVRGRDE